MKPSPVFIGGLDRSGKTYLRFMLEAHPEIVFSKRTNLWPKYFLKFGSLEKPENFEKCCAALAKNKHILELEPDFDLIREQFFQGETTYARLFEIIHTQFAVKHEKNYWGDQTEFLEGFAAKILAAYPTAKFIQMIRDPRDRYEAALEKASSRKELGVATFRWLASAKYGQNLLSSFPDRYKILRYESMVEAPEAAMQEVCSFLGIDYTAKMIALKEVARFEKISVETQRDNLSPLSTDFIGRGQKNLNGSQLAFIQLFLKRWMQWLKYPLAPAVLKGSEKISFPLIFLPVNLLQMLAWKGLVWLRKVR